MTKVITRLFSLSLILSSSNIYAATLLEIYKAGRDSDPEYLAALADAKAQMEYAPQNTAPLLPQVRLDAGWQRSMPILLEGNAFSNGSNNTWRATITLEQTIFDGVKLINYKASDLRLAHAKIDISRAENALIWKAANAYISYLQARNDLAFSQAEITALDKQLKDLEARYEVGLLAITDLEEIRARKDVATSNLLSATNAVQNAEEIVAEIFGDSVGTIPDFKSDMAIQLPQPASAEAWVTTGQKQNLDYQYLQVSKKLAEGNVKRQFARHLPVVSARAEYDYLNRPDAALPEEVIDRRIGINISVPLFGGGQIFSHRREAEYTLQNIEHRMEASKRTVTRNIRSNYRNIETAISLSKALTQTKKSAQTSLEAIREGYDAGSRTITDVLNAERDVLRAQRDSANARYQYILSHLQLALVTGQLSADNLIELNNQLEGRGLQFD